MYASNAIRRCRDRRLIHVLGPQSIPQGIKRENPSDLLSSVLQWGALKNDNGNFTTAELCTNGRLVGRSVWNIKWMLLIPGRTLLSDPVEGINRFIYRPMKTGLISGPTGHGVTDIKLFFS